MTKPKIGIIIGTTRQGRFGEKPAAWLKAIADKRGDADYEIVDLRDYPLPLFDEPRSPAFAPPANEVAKRWGEKIASLDGFVFITAEYNHGVSGALKNALDYAYKEWTRKAAAYVGYGGVGAARAIQQLRQNLIELQVAPIRFSVNIVRTEFMPILMEGKSLDDFPYLAEAATAMLKDLVWWTKALAAARAA